MYLGPNNIDTTWKTNTNKVTLISFLNNYHHLLVRCAHLWGTTQLLKPWIQIGQRYHLLLVFYQNNPLPQSGWLKTTEIYFLIALEAGSSRSRVNRVGFFWGLSPWLVDGRLLPVSSHGLPSVHLYVLISSSYKDTSYTGLVSSLMTLF